MVFFVSFSGHLLFSQPSDEVCETLHTREVWSACQAQVPFCKSVLVPECDCAVLQIINYSRPALPGSFGNLSSLVLFGVYTGNLKELPHLLGQNHKRLAALRVINNHLKHIPQSVGSLSMATT